jgi:hydrogenase maturation protease
MNQPLGALVAGVGNLFLGDDGFGVEVARRLRPRPGMTVVDFGIRGWDLACALGRGWRQVVLVDAVAGGHRPGTLVVIEPALEALPCDPPAAIAAHTLVPAQVLALARALGPLPPIQLVGCQPGPLPEDPEPCVGLSAAVAAAVEPAMRIIEDLIEGRAGGARARYHR